MKILFVYPNVTRIKSPQLGICMVAAVARDLGHECDLFDLTVVPEGREAVSFRSKIEAFDPNLLAISCRSNEWATVVDLLQSVSLEGRTVVVGGPHATVAPEETLEFADIAVIGEGEDTFRRILLGLDRGEDVSGEAGCRARRGSKVIENDMPDLIEDLDELPLPFWNIFDDVHFYGSYLVPFFDGARVVGTFEGSRGCPYACSYCTNEYVRKLFKGKGKWRREKSPERLVEEMRAFREEYGLDCVYWIDEILLTSVSRLERFRDLYVSQIGVPFVFMERPENMVDERIRIIKETGAKAVSIGIESGDEALRRKLLNRHHSQKTIVSAFQRARKHGLTTHAFTMIGFPGESRESIKETYRLLNEARPDTVQTTIFYPLRKTRLYEKVVEEGLFDPNMPMLGDYYAESALKMGKDRKKALVRYQYLLQYYDNPVVYFFAKTQPSHAVFKLFVTAFEVYRRIRREGLASTLRSMIDKRFKGGRRRRPRGGQPKTAKEGCAVQ